MKRSNFTVFPTNSRIYDLCAGIVQPLEVMGRQEIQQQAAVEITLSEMSPFISDVSQGQLQPQVCELIEL